MAEVTTAFPSSAGLPITKTLGTDGMVGTFYYSAPLGAMLYNTSTSFVGMPFGQMEYYTAATDGSYTLNGRCLDVADATFKNLDFLTPFAHCPFGAPGAPTSCLNTGTANSPYYNEPSDMWNLTTPQINFTVWLSKSTGMPTGHSLALYRSVFPGEPKTNVITTYGFRNAANITSTAAEAMDLAAVLTPPPTCSAQAVTAVCSDCAAVPEFCDATLASAGPLNVTWYRAHPEGLSDPASHNVADALGDTGFVCLTEVGAGGHIGAGGDNVTTQYEMEINPNFGPYAFCNSEHGEAGTCFGGNGVSIGQEGAIGLGRYAGRCSGPANANQIGNWYSMPQEGQCDTGKAVGTQNSYGKVCTWRVVRKVKTVSNDWRLPELDPCSRHNDDCGRGNDDDCGSSGDDDCGSGEHDDDIGGDDDDCGCAIVNDHRVPAAPTTQAPTPTNTVSFTAALGGFTFSTFNALAQTDFKTAVAESLGLAFQPGGARRMLAGAIAQPAVALSDILGHISPSGGHSVTCKVSATAASEQQAAQATYYAQQSSFASTLRGTFLSTLANTAPPGLTVGVSAVAGPSGGHPAPTTQAPVGSTTQAPAGGSDEGKKVGLGVGLGLGIPAVAAAAYFSRRRETAGARRAPMQQSFLQQSNQDLDGHYSEL
eukprot:g1362.t1